MIKTNQNKVLNGLLLYVLASPVLAEDSGWLSGIYATANIGRVNSHVSIIEAQAEFNDAGIADTTISDIDSQRLGYSIGVGYEIATSLAVELAYLDLGQVDIKFTSNQTVNNLDRVHPESGDGFTVSGLYKHELNPKTNARFRLGFFDWQADYHTTQGSSPITKGKGSDSGTDMYWGVGFDHQIIDEFTLLGEFQYFDFDRDDSVYLMIGAEWRY